MKEGDMATARKALRTRERAKKKKPSFVRHESWRYIRLKENWRRPRGLDNKMRRKIKGWPPTVSVGYRGPKVARGLHPSGYKEVLVYNVDGLKKIDSETEAVRIAHTVGKRKRTRILTEARKKKIIILNPKEVRELEEVTEEKVEKAEEAEAEEKETEEIEEKAAEETEKPKRTRKRKKTKEEGVEMQ